ncbi:DUF2306 domain-containing protein [Planomonospora sp. ID67723]|uniref:DUF2306 domain-containing protein n=1 Tax=Planomonospora sp. ID67723 TaxID=2738134 RepID=UPI0018C3D3F1|nr:DUF2306 domain-containing protein [Planomonospora sp. ID67723]
MAEQTSTVDPAKGGPSRIPSGTGRTGRMEAVRPGVPRVRWWRRPWVAPLAVVAFAFLAFSLPPYLSLDPSLSRVPPPEGFAAYHPLLVAHILFGAVAMITCCLQIWPWFRQRHPAVHRLAGRVYVLGGVLPAGALGLVIGAFSPFGPMARVSNVILAALWLAFTVAGFRTARQRRFTDHRRWMIRSFALTMSIITNRIWGAIAAIILVPQLDTAFGGSETALVQAIAGLATWLGWTTSLLLAEWWLERGDAARRRRRTAVGTRPRLSA